MTAEEAIKLSRRQLLTETIEEVLEEIRISAMGGKTYMAFPKFLDTEICKRLEELGYEVTKTKDTCSRKVTFVYWF